MNTYMIGNLIGRAMVCYLVVFAVILIFQRFQYRRAVKLTHSTKAIAAMLLLLILPVLLQTPLAR